MRHFHEMFLDQLDTYRFKEDVAVRSHFQTHTEELSYRDLIARSDQLAGYILRQCPGSTKPIPVYGHKRPTMLVAFLAAVKTGRAYCPIDTNMPADRVVSILKQVEPDLVLLTEPLDIDEDWPSVALFDSARQKEIFSGDPPSDLSKQRMQESDVFYILFTSGSSGEPKGVEITYKNLNRFLRWSVTFFEERPGLCFMNQAPFSFDLSVMELYSCLYTGGTLIALSREVQMQFSQLSKVFQSERIQFWVSTPSFANFCLSDPSFEAAALPHLSYLWFCGETLPHNTAALLRERFPKAKVFNTYGPTESTVAVTSIEITDSVLREYDPLPIGKCKPGTEIRFEAIDPETDGSAEGEMIITGDTVAAGYFKKPELSASAFTPENGLRSYRTGDRGYEKDGWLFYAGRIDFQVKLHGYRIELGDIENNLRSLPYVKEAAVLPRVGSAQEVTSLVAYIVYEKPVYKKLAVMKELKTGLRERLPEYMIPKNIVIVDHMPMTMNGKVDKKALEDLR